MHLDQTVAKESMLPFSFKPNHVSRPWTHSRCHNYCGRKCKVRRATGLERGPTAEDGNNFYSLKYSPTTISVTTNVRTRKHTNPHSRKHFRNAEPKGQSRCAIDFHVAGRDTRMFHRGFNIRNNPAIPAGTQREMRRAIITDISEIMEINCRQKAWKRNVAIRDAGLRRLWRQYVSAESLQNETPTRSENSFALRTRGSKQHTTVSTLSLSYSTWPMFFECVVCSV
jgi:hypothetical protein